MITRKLSIPHQSLSPNSAGHWGKKARHKKAAKEEAIVEFTGVTTTPGWKVVMNVAWFGATPSVMKMDDDNAWATLKATRDGIAHALNINDKDMRQGTMRFEIDKTNPRLEISLTTEFQ